MGQKYASLHAGLLARKGEAMPASRPGIIPDLIERGPAVRETRSPESQPAAKIIEAMSEPASRPAVHHQPTPRRAPSDATARAIHKTTLRLSQAQKRRLRLAAAVLDRSQQSLVSEALDEFLDILAADPALDCRCLSRCSGQAHGGAKTR